MKRSEVLDLIDGVLLEHELPLLQGISKEILGRLERAGMLPPTYERDPNEVELQAGLEKEDRVFVTEWEPEDG